MLVTNNNFSCQQLLSQVKKPGSPTEIDLDLNMGRQNLEQLHVEKPSISDKAWKRLSSKNKQRLKSDSGGSDEGNRVLCCAVLCCFVVKSLLFAYLDTVLIVITEALNANMLCVVLLQQLLFGEAI